MENALNPHFLGLLDDKTDIFFIPDNQVVLFFLLWDIICNHFVQLSKDFVGEKKQIYQEYFIRGLI